MDRIDLLFYATICAALLPMTEASGYSAATASAGFSTRTAENLNSGILP
jgi:hypothetical protein